MTRWKKSCTAVTLCCSVQLLSLGSFAKVFAGAMAMPALLKASAPAERTRVQLCGTQTSDDDLILASQNEAAEKSLGAEESVSIRLPSSIVSRFFLGTLITPKLSRYLAKSVLLL